MADPVLTPGRYSIGHDGSAAAFVYGLGAGSIQVQNTATDTGAVSVQDQAVVGHDGMLFGVDTLPGMVITQTGYAMTSPSAGASAMDAYSALAGAWNDPSVRLTDGAVQVLRASYRGSDVVRRCYGRGRKILPAYGQVFQGLVPFTAQFQCADNTWYDDVQQSVTLTFTGPVVGFAPPVGTPGGPGLVARQQANVVTNSGSLPTWPVITFTGPAHSPSLTYANTPVAIGYNGSLSSADTLVIDTRPWARTAILNGHASAAGSLSGDPMIAMQLWPGQTVVNLGGSGFTGATSCTVAWRSATLAIGGTQ